MKTKVYIYYPRALVGNGGPTVATWMWAQSLLEAGSEVKILYDSSLEAYQPLRVLGADLVPVAHKGHGRWRRPKNRSDLKIERNSFVFLHSAFLAGNLYVAKAARKNDAHTVFVPHGAYESAARQRSAFLKKLWFLWERQELNKALAIHAFVDSERVSIKEVARNTAVVVAPTPIQLPNIEWKGGGSYIAWFGRYDIEHKGLDLLIKAYAQTDPQVRIPLKLRGRDSTDGKDRVIQMVEKHAMSEWISIGPEIKGHQKIEFLKNAEFFIMPSRWESFSIALLEVLSIGVPSIVSEKMPIALQLKRENGAVISSIAVEDLAHLMNSALNNPHGTFKDLNPRLFVEKHLSSKVVGNNLLTQLREIQKRKIN